MPKSKKAHAQGRKHGVLLVWDYASCRLGAGKKKNKKFHDFCAKLKEMLEGLGHQCCCKAYARAHSEFMNDGVKNAFQKSGIEIIQFGSRGPGFHERIKNNVGGILGTRSLNIKTIFVLGPQRSLLGMLDRGGARRCNIIWMPTLCAIPRVHRWLDSNNVPLPYYLSEKHNSHNYDESDSRHSSMANDEESDDEYDTDSDAAVEEARRSSLLNGTPRPQSNQSVPATSSSSSIVKMHVLGLGAARPASTMAQPPQLNQSAFWRGGIPNKFSSSHSTTPTDRSSSEGPAVNQPEPKPREEDCEQPSPEAPFDSSLYNEGPAPVPVPPMVKHEDESDDSEDSVTLSRKPRRHVVIPYWRMPDSDSEEENKGGGQRLVVQSP